MPRSWCWLTRRAAVLALNYSDYLSRMAPPYIIYSSCNARTMATDIARLSGYRVERVQLFDMFPHTAHYEVLTLLVREV